jgi:hypothetical protein
MFKASNSGSLLENVEYVHIILFRNKLYESGLRDLSIIFTIVESVNYICQYRSQLTVTISHYCITSNK